MRDTANIALDSHVSRSVSENNVPAYFQVSGCGKDDVKLAVTPLDTGIYRFLCIYFEPDYKKRFCKWYRKKCLRTCSAKSQPNPIRYCNKHLHSLN